MAAKRAKSKKKGGRRRSEVSTGRSSRSWTFWLLQAVLFYLGLNLALNLFIFVSAPIDFRKLYELGYVDRRSEAAILLSRHLLWHWHSGWEDEQNLEGLVRAAAAEAGLDWRLLLALAEAESGLKPHAISYVGACGLTQLMPATARELGISDPFNARENAFGGARYLASLKRQFRGSVPLALAAYNAGPGAVQRAGGIPPFRETRRYVERITARYQVLKAGEKD